MVNIRKIPIRFRCSYCKGDMREKAKANKCECNSMHPRQGNKSGNKFLVTQLLYQGYLDRYHG